MKTLTWKNLCTSASLVSQMVKNLPTMLETWVWSLCLEQILEKGILSLQYSCGMAIHCGLLFWRIPWAEKPGGLQFLGSPRVRHDWGTLMKSTQKGLPDQVRRHLELALNTRGGGLLPFSLWCALHIQITCNNLLVFTVTGPQQT